MKWIVLLVLLLSDDKAQHKEWMDAAQDLTYDLKDALDARSSAKAKEPAAKLIQIGEKEEEYWRKAKFEEAVKLAEQNLAAIHDVAEAADAGHFDQALQAFGRLESTCRACHDAHPEKRI